MIKETLKRTPLYPIFILLRKDWGMFWWSLLGQKITPQDVLKLETVKQYAIAHNIKNFVETGTYLGQMVEGVKDTFSTITSIELHNTLADLAKTRFSYDDRITIIQGDSGERLKQCVADIETPTLFWLDAHYSAGFTARGTTNTPIINELKTIFGHPLYKEHVILIDDARCFDGTEDYPTTDAVEELIKSVDKDLLMLIKDDIIRIHMR